MVSEEDLPIDIQMKKLLDWLISRRLVTRDWHDGILPIRELIGSAIQDMPEHPKIGELLSGTHINYFHCLEIVDILKETEKDSKNFWGSYGSQRMKDWNSIIKNYSANSIYLGEAAQLLSQSVNYDLPAMKKSIAKSLQFSQECDKKEKDCHKKIQEFEADFKQSMCKLGLDPAHTSSKLIRKEIIGLLKDLPEIYDEISSKVKDLNPAMTLYQSTIDKQFQDEEGDKFQVLPTLKFLSQNGNVTTYQWIHGEAPISVEAPVMDFGPDDEDDEKEENEDQEDAIDFGEDEIDFGGGDDDGGDIDWGNLGDNDEEIQTDEINWDVDVGEIVVEDGGVDGGVARDSDALTLLDNRRTRTLILDELAELECFLSQKLSELNNGDDNSYSLIESSGGGGTQDVNLISKSIPQVNKITNDLTTGKMHHLQLIRSSPKYVDRMVDSLKSKLNLAVKMKNKISDIADKRTEASNSSVEIQRKYDNVFAKTKILQENICRDISKRYKNRIVNIMGGVQAL